MMAELETMAIEDIDAGLAANFEGSLSGLGVDFNNAAYNMSDALLALPCFKDEVLGVTVNGGAVTSDNIAIHQRIRSASQSSINQTSPKFQYALKAATSPAVKVEEESLTYLNQGQSYELTIKRTCENGPKTLHRSVVRVSFHERRMQYMEREHLDYWRRVRPGERLLDIDLPLSYGLRDVKIDRHQLNSVEIIWDSSVDCGVFVKLNCISTEFTAKKHGGEKGIPFRLTVDTFNYNTGEHLHSGAAQVKVFKPKGADRKHKTDREKVDRRPLSEKSIYQPPSDFTYLLEVSYQPIPEVEPGGKSTITPGKTSMSGKSPASKSSSSTTTVGLYRGGPGSVVASAVTQVPAASSAASPSSVVSPGARRTSYPLIDSRQARGQDLVQVAATSSVVSKTPDTERPLKQEYSPCSQPPSSPSDSLCSLGPCAELSIYSSTQEVLEWLQVHRFNHLMPVFQNFAGSDILRLTRTDLVEICGPSDGIRLSNALQQKPPRPKLTLYLCCNSETIYHAVYLYSLSMEELHQRIATLFQADISHISSIILYGPGGISISMTTEVVRNLSDHGRFTLHVVSDSEKNGQYRIILKPDDALQLQAV